eukprot:351698-Chlamydomonas_euryale.AAC.5
MVSFPRAPFHVAPFHVAPFHVAPFHVAPFHVAPFHVAPFHVAPFHGAPFHGAPFPSPSCSATLYFLTWLHIRYAARDLRDRFPCRCRMQAHGRHLPAPDGPFELDAVTWPPHVDGHEVHVGGVAVRNARARPQQPLSQRKREWAIGR